MKRSVMAVVISAMLLAASAAMVSSCNWMEDFLETGSGTGKSDEPVIPMDEVRNIGEVLAGDFAGDTVWVRGYVVGGLSSDGSIDFGFENDVLGTVLILADTDDCTDEDECLALQLTKKAHREAIGPDAPANREKVLHHLLYVQGKVGKHKGYPALSNLCSYKLA